MAPYGFDQLSGHPISHSTKSGLSRGRELRRPGEDGAPPFDVAWTRRPRVARPSPLRPEPFTLSFPRTVGVGQSRASAASWGLTAAPGEGLRFQPSDTDASGVGQHSAADARLTCIFAPANVAPFVATTVGLRPPPPKVGVGQNEDSPSAMRRSHLVRGQHAPLRIEPQAGQVPENSPEPLSDEPRDVLQEHERRFHLANDPNDFWPEPALVCDTTAPAGEGPGLTREARSEAIHDATPRLAVERGNVVPERSRTKGRVFHPRHEDGRRKGFPFDESHNPGSRLGEDDSEIETSSSGADRKHVEGT